MTASTRDREIVRDLARRVAEIGALPVQDERHELWTRHNDLAPVRPMVLVFPEGSWGFRGHNTPMAPDGAGRRRWRAGTPVLGRVVVPAMPHGNSPKSRRGNGLRAGASPPGDGSFGRVEIT